MEHDLPWIPIPWDDAPAMGRLGFTPRPRDSMHPTWIHGGTHFVKRVRDERDLWWAANVWRVHRAAGARYIPSAAHLDALVTPLLHGAHSHHEIRPQPIGTPPAEGWQHRIAGTLLADWLTEQDDRHLGNYLWHPSHWGEPVSIDHGTPNVWLLPGRVPVYQEALSHLIPRLHPTMRPHTVLTVPREHALAAARETEAMYEEAWDAGVHPPGRPTSYPFPATRLHNWLATHPDAPEVPLHRLS